MSALEERTGYDGEDRAGSADPIAADPRTTDPRTAGLLEATIALASACTVGDIAAIIAPYAARVMEASASAVYVRDGDLLRLMGDVGFEPNAVDGCVPVDAEVPVARAVRDGAAEWIADGGALRARYPGLDAEIDRVGRTALAVLPLRAGGMVSGALALAYDDEKVFTATDLTYASVLAEQCAQALERARLFRQERLARARAEALQRLAVAVSRAHTLEAAATEAVRHGMEATGTQYGVLALLDETGEWFEIREAPDSPSDMLAKWSRYPNAGPLPAAVAVRTGAPCYSHTRAEYAARAPGLAEIAERVGFEAEAVLPLQVGERTLGVLSFGFRTPQAFSADDDAFLRAVADLTAQALERSRLLQTAERARAEAERIGRAHQRDAEELERLYHNNSVGLAYVDRELRYVRINPALAALNGQPIDAHLGRTVFEVLPRFADGLAALYRQVLDRGEPILNMEVSGERATEPSAVGTWILNLLPVRDDDGIVTGVNVIVHDITERKQVLEQLRASEHALQASHARKDEFIATLAHELRNPLAPMQNAVALIPRDGTVGSTVEYAREVIDRQLRQLTRLVDDLLDASRVGTGRLILQMRDLDLREALDLAIETSRPQLSAARHRLAVRLPEGPLPLRGDLTRLAQLFANLLNNAAKFMAPEGLVEVLAERVDDRVLVSVRDEGIGIRGDRLERVFEMFAQVPSGDVRASEGLGIGLSLVRQLALLHGGRVEARSDGEQRGSVFRVELPLGPVASVTSPTESGAPASAARSGAPSGGRRVLIVDDNVDAAESLAILLELRGHRVQLAHTGAQALTACEADAPEVILLDLGLPDMSGLDVCRTVRARDATAASLIVALTGWGQQRDRDLTEEARFDHHLVKPAHPDDIHALIAADAERERMPANDVTMRVQSA